MNFSVLLNDRRRPPKTRNASRRKDNAAKSFSSPVVGYFAILPKVSVFCNRDFVAVDEIYYVTFSVFCNTFLPIFCLKT